MRLHIARTNTASRVDDADIMRNELSDALEEALHELEILPDSAEGKLVGLYAIMDDMRDAIRRTEALDLRRCA